MENRIKIIDVYAKHILKSETTGHDYYHALRVMNNALQIAKVEDVNLEIIKVASLTHDLIDRKVSKDISKSLVELELKLKEAKYTFEEVSKILDIIQDMSFTKGKVPNSLEGKIVQDADRLDALGAIGIARTFSYGGKNHRMIYNPDKADNMDSISHFYDKLMKLKDLMNTPQARSIANLRTKYMVEYLEKFYQEWEGKDL